MVHFLSKKCFDHFAVDVGESVVAALVAEGETLVIDTELVHEGGMEVVHRYFVFYD
jgi:hypothetical protein